MKNSVFRYIVLCRNYLHSDEPFYVDFPYDGLSKTDAIKDCYSKGYEPYRVIVKLIWYEKYLSKKYSIARKDLIDPYPCITKKFSELKERTSAIEPSGEENGRN